MQRLNCEVHLGKALVIIFCVLSQCLLMSQDFPPNPIEKDGYYLDFGDDFDTPTLNTRNWFSYYLPQWSSKSKTATNFVIENGRLVLKIDKDQEPWSEEFNGNVKVSSLQTGVFSGKIGSSEGQHRIASNCVVREEQNTTKLYTPTYGYFEIRAKALPHPNNVCAFWMIGFEDEPQKSGEICLMEIKGENVKQESAINGYGVRAFSDSTLENEFFEEEFKIDAMAFNIYAAEWFPDRIEFFINNQKVRTVKQSPSYEMQFMLNIYEVPLPSEAAVLGMQYPKRFEIDYVRAYQPNNGYVVTK